MNSKQFVSSSVSFLWDKCSKCKRKLKTGKTGKFFRFWVVKYPLLGIMSFPHFFAYYTYPAFENYAISKPFKSLPNIKGISIIYLTVFILLFVVQGFIALLNGRFLIDNNIVTKNFLEDWVDIINYTVICEAYIILGITFLINMYKIEGDLQSSHILFEAVDENKRRTNISSIISVILIVIISMVVVMSYKNDMEKSDYVYWYMEKSGNEFIYGFAGYYYFIISIILMVFILWVGFAHFGLFKVAAKISLRLKNDIKSKTYKDWEDEHAVKNKLAPFSWLIVNSKAFVLVLAINVMLWKWNEPNHDLNYTLSVLVIAIFGIWIFSLPRYYIQFHYLQIRKKLNIEEYKDLRIPWVLGISSVIDIILISIVIRVLVSPEFADLIDKFFS